MLFCLDNLLGKVFDVSIVRLLFVVMCYYYYDYFNFVHVSCFPGFESRKLN